MNELLHALRDATGLPLKPREVVVQRNVGSRLGGMSARQDHISWRGFNLLLLDARGHPRFYAKCRPAGSPRAARERTIHLGLSQDAETAGMVAPAQFLEAGPVGVLLLGFIDAPALRATFQGRSLQHVREVLADVLVRASRLAQQSTSISRSSMTMGGGEPIEHRAGLRRWFEAAEADAQVKAELERCLRVLEGLQCVPQHGDLTVDNVLARQGRPVFLDLETPGEFDIPLRDAWSIVRSLPAAMNPSSTGDWWRGPQVGVVMEIAGRSGLSAEEAWATLPVYLADYAGALVLRGVPAQFASSYLSETERVLRDRLSDPDR